MRSACLLPLALSLAAMPALAAPALNVSIEVPRLEVSEYHRPYVAVWVEREDQSVAANLAVWYAVNGREGTKWLADLRQWWRRSGRSTPVPIDGVTGATRPAGVHQLRFEAGKAPLGDLPAGKYAVVIEAAREVGGREIVKLPFEWPARAAARAEARGSSELGAVSIDLAP